jgi:acyl-CoA thioesterase FadM
MSDAVPTFAVKRKIRFGHVDPAGIVYYPHFRRIA